MGQILRAICPWILSSGTHPNCLESFDKILLSPKTKMQFSGISIGEVIEDQIENRVEVRLFSDPDQIFLVNVVLEKSTDLEAM